MTTFLPTAVPTTRRLFVFRGVMFDYTDGIAFAIADTKELAITAILKRFSFDRDHDIDDVEGYTRPRSLGTWDGDYEDLRRELKACEPEQYPITGVDIGHYQGGGS